MYNSWALQYEYINFEYTYEVMIIDLITDTILLHFLKRLLFFTNISLFKCSVQCLFLQLYIKRTE